MRRPGVEVPTDQGSGGCEVGGDGWRGGVEGSVGLPSPEGKTPSRAEGWLRLVSGCGPGLAGWGGYHYYRVFLARY